MSVFMRQNSFYVFALKIWNVSRDGHKSDESPFTNPQKSSHVGPTKIQTQKTR